MPIPHFIGTSLPEKEVNTEMETSVILKFIIDDACYDLKQNGR